MDNKKTIEQLLDVSNINPDDDAFKKIIDERAKQICMMMLHQTKKNVETDLRANQTLGRKWFCFF